MRTVVLGSNEPWIDKYLSDLSYNILHLQDNNSIDKRLKNHADLAFLPLNEHLFVVDKNQTEIISFINQQGSEAIAVDGAKGQYPDDCCLNFVVHNSTVYGCNKALTFQINQLLIEKEIEFKTVKQGYAKCSTIMLKNAAITDDSSIYEVLNRDKIKSLLVSKGDIKLPGFDYGFIGGASAVDNFSKRIVFFGDVSQHRDYELIKTFTTANGYTIEYFPQKSLTDIGSAFII